MFSVKNNRNNGARNATLYLVRIAFMAAMLSAFKFALSFIPNVEVVTLLIIVFASALGLAYVLPSVLVFCTVEIALYGVGSWVLLYYIYWTALAVVAGLTLKGRRLWLAVILGVVGSAIFGVLSACCDTLFCVVNIAPSRLGDYFIAYYIRGLYFDIIHMISNLIILCVLYVPLVGVLKRVAPVATSSVRFPKRMRLYVREEYFRN